MDRNKRIGNNVKIIREWNGIKQEVMASMLFVSLSKYYKCEKGERSFSDEELKEISINSGIPINDITNGDLSTSDYYKMYFKKGIKMFDSVPEFDKASKKIVECYFPFVNSDTKSEYFNKGIELSKNIHTFNIDSIVDTILNFMKSYNEDQVIEGAVNTLSALGYLWFFYCGRAVNLKRYEDSKEKEASSIYEVNDILFKLFDDEKFEKCRIEFFDNCGQILEDFIEVVREDSTYYDYAYFYMAIRYVFRMYDCSKNLSSEQSHMIGIELLMTIANAGNKYALNNIQIINDEYLNNFSKV